MALILRIDPNKPENTNLSHNIWLNVAHSDRFRPRGINLSGYIPYKSWATSWTDIFGKPVTTYSIPEHITEDTVGKYQFNRNNTKVIAYPSAPMTGKGIWVDYTRIHIGRQWLIYEGDKYKEDGYHIIVTDRWHHEVPTIKEVYDSIGQYGVFRQESLSVELTEFIDNGWDFDTGKLKIRPIKDSLLYIGAFDLDVKFKPISFLRLWLDGFGGIKPVAITPGTPYVPRERQIPLTL